MTAPVYWSQPNQQVVRNGEPVGIVDDNPDPQTSSKPEGALFDPGDHTVAEVNDYLEANPDDEARVLKAERKGKARASLLGE